MKSFLKRLAVAGALAVLPFGGAVAQEDEVEITLEHLSGNLYVLFGQGGNIGVSAGDEGVFLIDDQFAPLTEPILAAIREVNDGPVRFVLNTHWHGDHTGGNENLGRAGAVIIAHDNVRTRLAQGMERADGRLTPPAPEGALPVITFNDKASVFINGEEARAIHASHAHTDGDSMILFKQSNVLHTGDVFFNQRYPFIDAESGGTIGGMIKAVDKALEKAGPDTIVIPGHGPVTDRAGLAAYRELLVTVRDRVAEMKAGGKTLAEVLEAAPSAEYDAVWAWGFINAGRFVTAIYNTLP